MSERNESSHGSAAGALAACGTVALYLLAAAVGSLIYPFVIWEGGLRPFLRCQSLQTHLTACLALLPLVSEWKPPQWLRGLTALRAGRLGFGLPGRITRVERVPAVTGESLLSSSKRTMVWVRVWSNSGGIGVAGSIHPCNGECCTKC